MSVGILISMGTHFSKCSTVIDIMEKYLHRSREEAASHLECRSGLNQYHIWMLDILRLANLRNHLRLVSCMPCSNQWLAQSWECLHNEPKILVSCSMLWNAVQGLIHTRMKSVDTWVQGLVYGLELGKYFSNEPAFTDPDIFYLYTLSARKAHM